MENTDRVKEFDKFLSYVKNDAGHYKYDLVESFVEDYLSNSAPSESQSVVDNEFKKEILKNIIDKAKAELTEDNYWTFRGMLVEFSK